MTDLRPVFKIINEPPMPYSEFYRKVTVVVGTNGLKYAKLELPIPEKQGNPYGPEVLYAEFLMVAEYYKHYHRAPGEDVHLIYKDGDIKNDKVENLLWSCHTDVVLERERRRYADEEDIDPKKVQRIKKLLDGGVGWNVVAEILGINESYLRYIIHTKAPYLTGDVFMNKQKHQIQCKWGTDPRNKKAVTGVSVEYGVPESYARKLLTE